MNLVKFICTFAPFMAFFLQYLGLFLLSSVKFLFAVLPLLAMSQTHWAFDMFVCMAGGCFGVFVFTLLSKQILDFFKRKNFAQPTFKRLRSFVKLKNGSGLIGISILSPMLISIPVGCFLSSAIENNKKKILIYQCSSVILWSIVLFGTKGIFGFNLKDLF